MYNPLVGLQWFNYKSIARLCNLYPGVPSLFSNDFCMFRYQYTSSGMTIQDRPYWSRLARKQSEAQYTQTRNIRTTIHSTVYAGTAPS